MRPVRIQASNLNRPTKISLRSKCDSFINLPLFFSKFCANRVSLWLNFKRICKLFRFSKKLKPPPHGIATLA
jgi:hypothetical protein